MGTTSNLFATCARGLEPLLVNELRQLGAQAVELGRGGVAFTGDQVLLYQANLCLRTAIRVLQAVLQAPVTNPDDLYAAVQTLDWSHYLTADHTLAVDCNVRDSHLTHSHYAALKVKDAICDQFMARTGRRPSVDLDEPMVKLNLHVASDQAVLSLDSSGESLHKRGYRPIQTKAPLNEALAAGLVLATGWDGTTAFVDPMCGSGTLCIEAAWMALRRPPGLTRRRFGFMGWMDFDVALWNELRDQARQNVRKELPFPVLGYDARRDAVAFSDGNARAAGIGNLLRFAVREIGDFQPPPGPPGTILCNPPYGERLGDEIELVELYRTLGTTLRQRCPGWRLFVFTAAKRLARQLGPVQERIPLYNGKISCNLLHLA